MDTQKKFEFRWRKEKKKKTCFSSPARSFLKNIQFSFCKLSFVKGIFSDLTTSFYEKSPKILTKTAYFQNFS